MTDKYITMVKIAVPFDGEPHAMQTKAQNLASSAVDVKTALVDLVASAGVERDPVGDKLQKIINAASASTEDEALYEHNLKLAVKDLQKVFDQNAEVDKQLFVAIDKANAALHASNCVTVIEGKCYGEPEEQDAGGEPAAEEEGE